jgi:Tol biopolymer transport system component
VPSKAAREQDRQECAIQTPYNELHPQFSADGKWIAYTSDETGRNEVYVQPFPVSGAKVQISTARGHAGQMASGWEGAFLSRVRRQDDGR